MNVTKQVTGGNGSFTFTTSDGPGGPPARFTLSTSAGTATTAFVVVPGTYTVSESAGSPDFTQTAINCGPGGSANGAATFTVTAGGSVGCGFTNTLKGTMNITKQVIGGNGSFTFTTSDGPGGPPASFTLSTSAGTATTAFVVVPGTYTVSESAGSPDFTQTAINCGPGGRTGSAAGKKVDPGGGRV